MHTSNSSDILPASCTVQYRFVLELYCVFTLEQQVSTLGPFADAFVGSNSLNAGQVKDWPGALTGEMLSQVTGCKDTHTANSTHQVAFSVCTLLHCVHKGTDAPYIHGAMKLVQGG
jgi:hypothetical protein